MKKNFLGIIPARGGSKGIPDKNIKLLGDKPLLAHTIETCHESGIFDRVILSTDSQQIADVGRHFGVEVPFLRPAELAQDDTPMLPVLQHVINYCEELGWKPDIVVIMQPTAPFRQVRHLRQARDLIIDCECDSVVSVEPVPEHYAPHFVMKINDGILIHFLPDGANITRRQDVEKAYTRNGCFYFTQRDVLMNENSIYGKICYPIIINDTNMINIDTMDDWFLAEKLVKRLC